MESIPVSPRLPTQAEIEVKLCVLSKAARWIEITQDGNIKDRAVRDLNEAYIWLAAHRINFYYDRKTDSFRV